jgi:hypothetical protein
MNETCGCCEGIEKLTPAQIANRPGLKALAYRVGTHATFLETMLARLSDLRMEELDERNPLLALKTRASEDASIALLDAWATVADVLTFYQERMANEGYLLTATERRSILELARLVGYQLRPGVSASVYLAFTMEKDFEGEIPAGVRAQSIPGPGELPQSFETAEPLMGRAAWNELRPRMSRPQFLTIIQKNNKDSLNTNTLYFRGAALNLKPNDPILIDFGTKQLTFRILKVESDTEADRTKVTLESSEITTEPTSLSDFLARLLQPLPPGTVPPQTPIRLFRNLAAGFAGKSDLGPRVLTKLQPNLQRDLYQAWRNATVTDPNPVKVYAFRLTASLFGHNVPKQIKYTGGQPDLPSTWPEWEPEKDEKGELIFLDNAYDKVVREDYVAIQKPDGSPIGIFKIADVAIQPRFAYGISGKTTKISLPTGQTWWTPGPGLFNIIRGTVVYTQSESLELAEEPMEDPIGFDSDPLRRDDPTNGRRIELDNVYDGLESGRWLVVSGERVDIPGVTGVTASELVMLAGATQEVQKIQVNDEIKALPGDTTHTILQLANRLAFRYKRGTVTINANVARATHGETRSEVLGSGDSSKPFQNFTLRQPPLTYVSATTPSGIESTLEVRVNDILWRETDSLVGLNPTDRNYLTQTDNEGKTTVVSGNGVQGARLPTGVENVKAVYRTGIGKAGNVAAKSISLLATRPLGVKVVINPLPATGGADPESRDQARLNATIHLKALDRAVSVQDYADFARAFTGIGKAAAVRLSDGRREVVHLTIAGAKDIPIDKQSDLYRNLLQALFRFGDPHQPVQVDMRELKLLVISAQVRILPDFLWEKVEPQIRAALLDTFSFDRRELGQDVTLSELLSAIQAVPGVDYVDVDKLGALDTDTIVNNLDSLDQVIAQLPEPRTEPRIIAELARVDRAATDPDKRILPAQLVYLTPDVSDTLILTERTR